MTRGQLWETFDQAAAEVGEVDFVETAWSRGQSLRRRRRALTGAAVVGGTIGAVVLAVAVLGGGTDGALDQVPAGTPTPTAIGLVEGVSVRTLAGQVGAPGSVDGRGSEARLETIQSIAVAPSGSVYLSDFATVRKVSPDGLVVTLATHDGTSARQDGPAGFGGIAVGPDETVYVIDSQQMIRKITADGTISEVATADVSAPSGDGTETASGVGSPLSSIRRLAVDAAGTLYVADGAWIRTVTLDGQVTTVGSCSQPPESGTCEHLAVAVDGTIHFLNDSAGFLSLRTMAPDGQVSSLVVDDSGTEARFGGGANGFALDPRDSTVYISYWEDSGWETFDKVTPDGVITTIDRGARGGAPGGSPGSLVDENGEPVISEPRYLGPLAMGPDGTMYAAAPNALLTLHGLPER